MLKIWCRTLHFRTKKVYIFYVAFAASSEIPAPSRPPNQPNFHYYPCHAASLRVWTLSCSPVCFVSVSFTKPSWLAPFNRLTEALNGEQHDETNIDN